MGTASNKQPTIEYSALIERTVRGCEAARLAAAATVDAITKGTPESLDTVKQREEELDTLDREINEGVTAAIVRVTPEQARELLGCLKLIMELERIGDLLLGFANRLRGCSSRLDPQDTKDLSTMAKLLQHMLADAEKAFSKRDTKMAVSVLRADTEVDRLRNLVLVRHIENPEGTQHQESFHIVFMAQSIERAGDHAKNIAEEVVQLVTGRSVRHLLRTSDMPFENMFVEFMRRKETAKKVG
jgi:phosphate transport system protein